ncbi:NCA2-domain-containing protein [Mycena metata]|uniref:NCA2-domain-containing protein n=1 Tax=Mycena metata TaxID=1033252 RepID=A0AAD7J6Y3_9AGAR|nr:NCA2-domain-containing protein [Mycena metata]
MSRLRVDSPLSLTHLPSPEPRVAASDATPVVTESAGTLRSLLVSLNPPVSQSSVDEALKPTLKSAVVNQVAVGLYARGLDIYLNEATEIEAEAEVVGQCRVSSLSLAWFLLQTLPSRLTRVLRTILDAFRDRQLPLRLSLFTPSSLFRIFPATALRPSCIDEFLLPSSRARTNFIHSIWSAIFLPLNLTREECRYKRRKLEKIRDERASSSANLLNSGLEWALGIRFPANLWLASAGLQLSLRITLNTSSTSHLSTFPATSPEHGNTIQQLRRPSRFILLWPKILLLPPLAFFTVKTLYASRSSIIEMALDAKETVEGFIKNSLIDPLKEVLKTGVAADLESLERMTLSLARDSLHYDEAQLATLSQKIKVGDLTPVLRLYEEDIKKPVKSALTGTLLRSVFIQVQKAKVDIDQALAGIDKLLKSQELTFAFVGLAPALVIVTLLGSYTSQLFRGGRGEGRFGGRDRRASAWLAMRRIERLLVSQPRLTSSRDDETSHSLSPLTTGLLLISVTRLRTFAESSLPRGSRLREGFLEDVGDLEDPAMPREEKLRVVERMWRSWGGALGWHHIAAQSSFSWRNVL